MNVAEINKAKRLIEQMKGQYFSPLLDTSFALLSGTQVKNDMTRMINTTERLLVAHEQSNNMLWEVSK